MALYRHRVQRVSEFRPAVTAHLIGLTLHGEHTAELRVVTSKEKIENSQDGRDKTFHRSLSAPLALNGVQPDEFATSCVPENGEQSLTPFTPS